MTDAASNSDSLAGGITREILESDGLRRALRLRHPDVATLDDRALCRSIDAMLTARPIDAEPIDGVWLFAYGSLLWNPCVAVSQRCTARLYGFHRDFRLKLTHGRGSPEAPGLMLGLVPGGSCVGMALRVPNRNLKHELLMVWRREMLTGVYEPRWVGLRAGGKRIVAVAFVVNPRHPCHCGRLTDADVVQLIATGHGMLGSSMEYLDNTVAHLDEQSIHDRRLRRLRTRVAAWREPPPREKGCGRP